MNGINNMINNLLYKSVEAPRIAGLHVPCEYGVIFGDITLYPTPQLNRAARYPNCYPLNKLDLFKYLELNVM